LPDGQPLSPGDRGWKEADLSRWARSDPAKVHRWREAQEKPRNQVERLLRADNAPPRQEFSAWPQLHSGVLIFGRFSGAFRASDKPCPAGDAFCPPIWVNERIVVRNQETELRQPRRLAIGHPLSALLRAITNYQPLAPANTY
jgi:hypothetical protein